MSAIPKSKVKGLQSFRWWQQKEISNFTVNSANEIHILHRARITYDNIGHDPTNTVPLGNYGGMLCGEAQRVSGTGSMSIQLDIVPTGSLNPFTDTLEGLGNRSWSSALWVMNYINLTNPFPFIDPQSELDANGQCDLVLHARFSTAGDVFNFNNMHYENLVLSSPIIKIQEIEVNFPW